MKAVDFVGALMGGFDYKVALLHVIRESELRLPQIGSARASKFLRDTAKNQLTPSLKRATKKPLSERAVWAGAIALKFPLT